ncbi:uncharacterized protein LOC122887334 [Siniperca chuatsi]|uniref:uncharacterized protein LOC122887334 n=1 Tax=Siniperca chuatsi TaxID=119488 RepID=UPI001CE2234A|nr:uncharacterized protein LOC122887334 [Siniperca chuatsi]
MAGENGRGHRSRQNVAVLLVLCALAPSLTCFSLRGLSKRVKQGKVVDEATVTDIRTGSILFDGKELNSRSGSASAAATGKDELLHVESDQSDGTGWSRERRQDMDSREASWRRMASSLQCGGDHLKFRAVGPGASQFVVEQGNAPPMPLSQVPSTCGYNIQRNSLALVMLVPYDGCNMVQEGGSYVLPMRWQGVPVLLRCPKTTTAAPTTTAVPVRTTAPTTKTPEMPHFPQYPLFPPFYPYFPPPPTTTTAAAPTTTAAASTTKTPEMPHFPQYPLFPPFYPYFTPPPATTTAAASTTKTPEIPHFP